MTYRSRQQYQRKYQRERKRKLRLACIQQLGSRCVDCGESDTSQLEFDYIADNSDRQHIRINFLLRRKGGLSNPVLQAELSLCQLRCTACHMAKDGRLIRDKWGDFKRLALTSVREDYRRNND